MRTPAGLAVPVQDIPRQTGTGIAAHRVDTTKLTGRGTLFALIHIFGKQMEKL